MTYTLNTYRDELNAHFADRVRYEVAKKGEDAAIIEKFTKMIKDEITNDRVIEALMLANVNTNFVNMQEKADARLNVYAVQKVFSLARTSIGANFLHRYIDTIYRTLINFTENNLSLTLQDAKASLCVELKAEDKNKQKLLVTYASRISDTTASTQASSTISALRITNIVIQTRNDKYKDAYIFNEQSEMHKQILKRIQ